MAEFTSQLPALMRKNEQQIVATWFEEQTKFLGNKVAGTELRSQCTDFLRLFTESLQTAKTENLQGAVWEPLKKLLGEVSRNRSLQGFTPTETAIFILSLKRPLFELLRREFAQNSQALADETWHVTTILDQLALYTTEIYQKTREDVIIRQQEEMLELSTPVVKLWDGILALPMIGTLDSSRTQVVMESLLQKIVETGSAIAIIDITGVPTVDTLVAQHLIKTVTAARLMGAECIISGIRPQIAATIVHLGVDLAGVLTKASLADAFAVALSRNGRTVVRVGANVQKAAAAPRGQSRNENVAMERIPILKMENFLLVTIQVDMHDQLAMTLQDDLSTKIVETGARAVLIDISALEIVDSFIGRMLAGIAGIARVLDAETVVVGMQPAVAITLVELGLSLEGIRTALNVDRGMTLLRESLKLSRTADDFHDDETPDDSFGSRDIVGHA